MEQIWHDSTPTISKFFASSVATRDTRLLGTIKSLKSQFGLFKTANDVHKECANLSTNQLRSRLLGCAETVFHALLRALPPRASNSGDLRTP